MAVLFTNNASSTLASAISNVQTSLTLATGTGALFPSISGSDYFYATIVNSSNLIEIVRVTARSGDVLTVLRGQEGTSARAYNAGDKVEVRVTAAGLNSKFDKTGGSITGNISQTGSLTVSGSGVFGAPTGGSKGDGTINATGLFVNGVAVGTGTGSVTSVAVSPGTTGLTVSGSPITTSGTITLGGTLALANGGTGATTAAAARTALGLGALATLATVNNAQWSGTALAIANGGTGVTTKEAALEALGGVGVAASDLSGSGYVKLTNGLYIMWGNTIANNDNYTTVTYPVTTTTWSVAVCSGGKISTGQQDNGPFVVSCTTTGFQIYSSIDAGSSVPVFWVAVGY